MTDVTPVNEGRLSARVGQAVVWNTVFAPLKFVAELVVNLVQLNLLPPAAYGVLALVRATVSLIGNWIDLGIERALPKFIPEVQRSGGTAAVRRLLLRSMLVKAAILVVVASGIWLLRGRFLQSLADQIRSNPDQGARATLLLQVANNGWFLIAAVIILLILGAFYDVLMAYLISYFRQRAWNAIALVNAVLQPFLIAAVVVLGWNVTGVVLAMVITPFIGVTLAAWQVLRQIRQPRPAEVDAVPEPNVLRRFVPYSALSYLLNVSDLAASQLIGVFVAGGLDGSSLVWAAFSFVRGILNYLYTPLGGLQVPLFTRARAGEGSTLDGAYGAVSRLLLLLLVPGGTGLFLLARPLVLGQYPRYLAAVPAILILIPCLFLESLLATSHNVLMVAERYRPIILSRCLAFSSLPLLWLLAPRYGTIGVATAIGIARIASSLVVFVAGQQLLDLHFPWRFASRLGLAACAMTLVVVPLRGLLPQTAPTIMLRLWVLALSGGLALIGAIVFVMALRLLGGLDARDRQQIVNLRMPLKRWILKVL